MIAVKFGCGRIGVDVGGEDMLSVEVGVAVGVGRSTLTVGVGVDGCDEESWFEFDNE